MRDHDVRVDLNKAVSIAYEFIRALDHHLINPITMDDSAHWAARATQITSWVITVRAYNIDGKLHILKKQADDLEGFAINIAKCTLAAHHLITDDKVMNTLAVKLRGLARPRGV